jgi:hypothetical protein
MNVIIQVSYNIPCLLPLAVYVRSSEKRLAIRISLIEWYIRFILIADSVADDTL